jgi:uncharacterized DUF497 family protein
MKGPRKFSTVDFEEAQALWQDAALIEVPAQAMDEPRWLAIAKWSDQHGSAVFRRRSERIRLISVRRARDEEVKIYESDAV